MSISTNSLDSLAYSNSELGSSLNDSFTHPQAGKRDLFFTDQLVDSLDLLIREVDAQRPTPIRSISPREKPSSSNYLNITNHEINITVLAAGRGPLEIPNSPAPSSLEEEIPTKDEPEENDLTTHTLSNINDWLMIRECNRMTLLKILAWAAIIFSLGIVYGLTAMVAESIDAAKRWEIEQLYIGINEKGEV